MQGNQQRKALLLSLLMFMLAQTAYIESYRGWTTPQLEDTLTEPARVNSPAVCASASRSSGDSIYVDVVEGSNDYPGTISCPLSSLEQAITIAGSESASNPEIILRAGLYHENVSIDNIDNLLIRAADGERVVFDGTRSITDDLGGVWGSADSDGIQEVTLSQDGWQLFLAHEEQVPARWPNAQFSDETVFNRSYWAEGTLTNSNNAYTQGWLTDAGPEAGVHTGLNETVNASGLDPVGAIAVMNLGSFRTNSRIITDWNPNNGTFAYDGTGVGWKTKHHAYFLEGKRELIDQDGEWWFNNSNNRLHYKTPSSRDANDLDLRVKVQPFAVSVDNSDGVTIQGIDFFGTTVNFNNCDGCSLTNASLQYPSTSKRGLGIAGESEDDRWMTRFYRSTNSFVDNISITNTDGGAIEFHGSGGQSHNNTVNNSYFHAIDWSAADQKGLMTTIYEGGRDMYFTNNSVHLTGASSVLSIGDAPKVFYNEVWDVGYLQTDGAVVQVMQGEAPGAEIAYNWIHDVIKYGARFDAPINEVGEGMNGTMHHNVIWNAAGGLMVKGDYHDIHNNTVFNSTGKNDIIFLTDGGINNKNSTLHYNAVDAMADHRSDDIFANPIPYGTDWMNWNGYIQGKQDAVTTLTGEINSGGWVRVGYTCIINSTKSLLCWGQNANGQLGLGNTTDQSSPVAVAFPDAGTVEKVADSGGFTHHNCAIMTNGSLYCWGMNSNGELGINSTTDQNTPQLVNLGPGVKAVDVSVGAAFTCAVTDAGALMCWGSNVYGKLGIGNTSSANYLTPQTVNLPTNRKAVDVGRLGRHFGYALLDNGEVVSWGRNHVGYLGTGNTTTMYSPTVISLDSQRQVVSMSGGKHHGCIGYDNGSVVCAGRDNVGQQGRNSPGDANDLTFSYTNALANLSIIALAGQYTSCALLANGTAQCWGGGGSGQMGDGTTGNNAYPDDLVNTLSGRFIVDMSMSGSHACIVLDDGSVACWGNNNRGQLGLGNTTNQYLPVVLTGLDDLSTTSVHEMLVDPANNDFRPNWGSHLHVLNAGAYDADDANPWTAGISWTYTTPNAPVPGCMLDYADNYDADATLSDGSCLFASYSPPSTLDLRLHLDPANSSSYSGSGTDLVDLSTYGNDGTIDGAAWEADRTRFYYDGSCSGATAPPNQAGTYVCDEVTFAETNDHDPDTNGDWSVSVWINATTVQHSVIIGKWNGGGSASDLGYIIRIGSDNKLYTSVGTTSGSSAVSTSRISIDEGRWYHLVMVADVGNMLRLYADGVNVANASLSVSGSIRNTTSGISIGSYNAGEYNQPFDGNIGEVMIFADALNSTTINQMYNASKGTYSNTTSLSYSDSSYTFVKGQAYNLPLSVSNGDLTTSYTLIGSLPSGMNFGSSNGTIWGTPTADMTSTTYTVTANNSAGSFSTTFSMQIMSAPSGITYSPSSMTLEKGTAMTTNTPTYNGSTVTSWSISPSLPAGLNFGSSNGTIWGIPTVLQTTATTYTIWANNSGGSTSATITITINDEAPGPFEYEPENNTWTNNTDVHLAPVFVNRTTGNGSTWQVADINSGTSGSHSAPGQRMSIIVGDTIYFDAFEAATGTELWAYDTSNQSLWRVIDIRSGSVGSNPGEYSNILVGDTLYFSANDGSTGQELWAHNTSNGTTWQVANIRSGSSHSNPGSNMVHVVNGVLYFNAHDGNKGMELWKHDPSTRTTSRIYDINAGSTGSSTGKYLNMAVGDVLYFSANDGSTGSELWAYNTSNSNDPWRVMDINSGSTGSEPGKHMSVLVGDTIYFDAGAAGGRELWAHNISNQSTWRVVDIHTGSIGSDPGDRMALLVGDTIYFDADDGSAGTELWAHDTSNHSTWRVSDIQGGSSAGSAPGHYMSVLVGNTVYFSAFTGSSGHELWAHDTSNHSTWMVADINSGNLASYPGEYMAISVGDTIYFSATDGTNVGGSGCELWAHDTSNRSTWKVVDIDSGPNSGTPGYWMEILVGDTLYFSADDGSTGHELWAHQPSRIDDNTNTGGAVTSWAINNTNLPTGLTFSTSNGTIYGTPTQLWSKTAYMVWANNSGGSSVAYLNITVVDELPTISYSPENVTLTNNTASSDLPLAPTITGLGAITSWTLNNTNLPTGISFGSTNGTLYGTSTQLWARTSYKVWANNSGGSVVAYFNLTVNDQVPTLSYSPENLTLTNNTASSNLPLAPTITGSGAITSWALNNTSLPTGISFNTSTGTFSGTPTELWPTQAYMVWANNSGGSTIAYLNITVNDQRPTLAYSPNTLILTKGNQSSDLPLNATLTGPGEITSWAINATLPAGLNFGTSNGTIWGIPTVMQTTALTYTIWANNSGGSTSATVTITINDEAPGPFEYIPENNTWTNNSYVNIGPSFINQTSGNGSTWAVSLPNSNLAMVVGDIVYLNGNNFFGSASLAALNTSNGTAWYPDVTWYLENGSVIANTFNHGQYMSYLIDDVIYFDAAGSGGVELWAYNTSNNSGWIVKEINTNNTYQNYNSNPGQLFSTFMGDTIYFSANSGNSSLGVELWAHDTSNGTTWRVGHTNTTGTLPITNAFTTYGRDLGVIDDTIYFQAWGSGDEGLWAYNTSNTTMWEIDFRSTSRSANPGKCMAVVVGETLYFDADASTHGRELWAHNHANQTTWMVKDFRTSNYHYQLRDGNPGCLGMSGVAVGDTFYFSVTTPYTVGNGELWAHSTSNHSTWLVADIFPGIAGTSVPGDRLAVVIGDTIYFDANDGGSSTKSVRDLWAHDTSNKTTWKVYNFSFAHDYIHSDALLLPIGDTLYFVASVNETRGGYFAHGLWAHDTSNQSTWVVEDGSSGYSPYWPGAGQSFFVNGTLYTHISTCTQNCNGLGGYNLLSINYQTNTGGNVTSWAINGSLPSGVTFNTQTGVLSGTPTELWPQTSYMVWANNSGGSSVAYLNITVVDELPTIAYSPTDITLTNNTVSSDLPLIPAVTGSGEITSWAINASLPAGLTFETSNGTIWGTPTELWTQTAYMVWANNSGGSSIAYLNITVVDQLPTISYVPENMTLTNNTASSDLPIAPTINGPGEITSWAINATLPAGLTFGSNNGTIYGTPTELWPTTSYTIWANNSGGSNVAYLNITVEDQLPTSLNYIPNGQNATINTAITAMNPSLTGPGQVTSWEIIPVLPQGVQFNSLTGVITGTPTELWTNTTYTIWANNSGGSINTTIWLMVTLPAPNISYNFVNITLTSNVSSINYNATNSGGDIAYGDNVIHGHSDVFCALSEQGQVVCWGDNIDGVARPGASTSADYSPSIVSMPTGRYATALAVGDQFACALLDNGSVACWGDADGTTALEYWDGDGIIEPTLMPGLGGTTVAIDIDAGYAHACVILSNLSAMCWGTNAWDNLGINSNSLSATPAHVSVIPSGRTIIDITAGHTHTCALLDNASVYCWGDNQRGQIGVGYTSSSIANGAYAQLDGKQVSVLEAGRDSTCVAFTGGGASCWGKNRDGMLGDGTTIDRSSPVEVLGLGDNDSISSFELSFDTTCIITTENIAICWGDETGNANGASTSPVEVDFPANRYAISIALDYDSGCAILDDGSVNCWGSGSDKNFGNNTTSYSDTPVSGVTQITHRANVGGYSIRGALPQGIQFSASNGTVWGMPTEVVSQFVSYSVTVYNSAGSSTYSFSIQVIDLLPTISYNPENLTFTNNTAHPDLPLAPNITGAGSITSWEISPSLPAGLNFGSENGTVWGVPSQLLNLTTFTVYANNSGGSSTATINMTIVDQVPVLIYNPSNITLTRGEQSDVLPLQPNLSGPGDVLIWEISPTLPNGIQFGSDNGTIWGIPTVNMTQTSFTIWANNSGGQTNFTINITILEPVAIFDYQPENLTLVRNETMTSLHPLITGGNPLTWEISPTLPSGLSFSDGVISGTPAVNSSTVMYTVWANNSGGSANHTINITILEPSGDLSYNPENLTLIRNQSMTTLNPIFTGGSVDNWSIFPALPSGLLFNNGLISGTPLVNSTTVTYTIWANNSGGVATTTINITILEPIVNLSYNPENITLIRNQSMNTLYPTVTGGVVSEWSIYPSLPLGLNFTNGVISGTPEVNMTMTMYAIYANTSAGSTFANINITILEPIVNLSFQPTEIILIRNLSMTSISAVVTGGSVATWEISPQLPSGLTFIDGTLNGTPLVNMTRSEFIIYANTSGGSANFSINITILEPAPQISINLQNITLMRYEQMDAISAEIIGDGMPENWSIHPVLPEGLFFENGTIYGTPAVNLTRSTFIIWANNTGGSTSIPFDIEILEPLPNISYSPENYTLTKGLDNVTINPISTGGMVANWSIYPELPQGMSFENGSISGISIVESLNVTYVITAVNSGGSAIAYLNISVVEQLPELSIDVNLSLIRYGEPANLTVNNSGGIASTWEIYPELPDGLSFVDGVLTGVALVNSTETVYTVWANNSGGSASASFSLEINEPSPDISYQTESYVAVYDATEVLIIPINTGGVPETWEISPQLPQGLQFRNGVIFGIATEEMNQTNYTVWANNSLGSSMTSFTLEVNYPVFFARYEKTRIVLEVNETMMPLTPIYYFGPSQSPTWSISDELPEGMKFNNGVISGAPQHPLNETEYTITVTGEMAPVELFVVIHVLGDWPQNATVLNETIEQPEPESPNEPELNFVIPLIFLLLLFIAALIGGNIFLAAIADDDEEVEEEDSENEDDIEEPEA